jgi:hypothetical protein
MDKPNPAKLYRPPTLLVYGNLTQMTQTSPKNLGGMEMPTGSPKT